MNAQRRSGSGDGRPAAPATLALPASLARRGRTLIDAVEAIIVNPRSVTLTERQRAEARDIVRKLVEGIEIDLQHFLPPHSFVPPIAWTMIAERGLPVEGLSHPVLARALERGFEDGHDDRDAHRHVPEWIAGDAELAALWMRYIVADRRRRDSWQAPMIVAADLPVEVQAAVTEYVAAAILAHQGGSATQTDNCADAVASVISLYREETGIDIAATRLVDAALSRQPVAVVMDDLIACAAWPAIMALLSRFSRTDQNHTTIFLCSATDDEIGAWLSPTGIGEGAIASLCQRIAMSGGPREHGREGGISDRRSGEPDGQSMAERIESASERYRTPPR